MTSKPRNLRLMFILFNYLAQVVLSLNVVVVVFLFQKLVSLKPLSFPVVHIGSIHTISNIYIKQHSLFRTLDLTNAWAFHIPLFLCKIALVSRYLYMYNPLANFMLQ